MKWIRGAASGAYALFVLGSLITDSISHRNSPDLGTSINKSLMQMKSKGPGEGKGKGEGEY